MPPRLPSRLGTAAITTSSSAITPLVVQSLTPSSRYASPSSVGVAVVPSRAGSEPTSDSVSRNALTAPLRTARQERRPSAPWCRTSSPARYADRLVGRQQRPDARVHRAREHQRAAVVGHREAESAVLERDLHAERTELGETLDVLVGDLRLALDQPAVEGLAVRRAAGRGTRRPRSVICGVAAWMRMDQGEVERRRGRAPWRSSAAPTPARGPPRRSRAPAAR